MAGRNIMMGYLNREDKTSEDIGKFWISFLTSKRATYMIQYIKIISDKNGYLHSGDLGTIDKEGFLKITGKNISCSNNFKHKLKMQ